MIAIPSGSSCRSAPPTCRTRAVCRRCSPSDLRALSLCGSDHDDGCPDRFPRLQGRNSAEANTTTDVLLASTNSDGGPQPAQNGGDRAHAVAGTASGTSAFTVGDRDMERLEADNAPVYVPNPSSDGGVGRSRICAARRGRRHAVPRPRSGLGASTNTTARAVGTSRMVPLDHPFLNSFAKRSSHGRPANSTSIHSDGNCCWRAVNHYRRVQPAVGTGSWRSGSVEQVGSR